MSTRDLIDDFLRQHRLAVVGVSRNPKDFSRSLFREFHRRGYDTVPVNPDAREVEGRPSFSRVGDITPPVDGVLLMTPPRVTESVVRECAQAGIRRVWMYQATGSGAVSRDAVAFCENNGIQVIPGYCPFMFFKDAGFFHRAHGFLMKLTRSYPN